MKQLLIGFANNISANKDGVRLWYKSFIKHSDAETVLIAANTTEEERLFCDQLGLKTELVELKDTRGINHKRIKYIIDFLRISDADIVLSTDVFDVAFQGNPFLKLNIDQYDFFVGSEGVKINQEPWNSNNINILFPGYYHKCSNQQVLCSGVVAGKRNVLIQIYERMLDLCENHSTNKHETQDQAALIVMANNNEIDRMKIFNLDDGWVVHSAVAGPTKFWQGWGFDKNLECGKPEICGNKICNAQGYVFDIVHQLNRIPEWHNMIIKEVVND
jgi:hypothetical protein